MKTRPRASRGERQSWRDRDAPISSGLLFYRRMVATLLVLLLVGAFIAVLIIFWPRRISWDSQHLVISQYNRESGPPLLYAKKQEDAWTSALPSIDVIGSATQSGELAASVAKLAGSVSKGRKGPLLVYVAGHGCSREDAAFLYPSDLNPFGDKGSGVSVKDLLAAVVKHPSQQTVLIIDSGPLEHDLRMGTAVNRFPEILESEVQKVQLAGDEELIVLSSHQTWERSFVSPREHWSVFGFYVNEGLTSQEYNADQLRFDRAPSDGEISLLELAGYVQQQTSGWVWKASSHTRTQRPQFLYARGSTRRTIDLVHETTTRDSHIERLDQIILPKIKAQPADADTAALISFESAAYGQEPAPTPATEKTSPTEKTEQGEGVPAADAAAAKSADAPPGEKGKGPAAPPAAAPEAPPQKDTRPQWLMEQVALAGSFGLAPAADDEKWAAADFDAPAVRRALRDMLYAQRKELTGTAVTADDAVELAAAPSRDWDPLRDWRPDAPTFAKLRHAARVRNATLLKLEQYIAALDAAESLAHDDRKLIDELDGLWLELHRAVARLGESMDQEIFLDTPASAPEGPTINISSGSVTGSVQDILSAGHLVQDSAQKLIARLEGLLLPKTPPPPGTPPTRWLPRWELAQAVPLGAWDAPWPDFAADSSIPPLSLTPPAPAADAKPPAGDKKPADAAPPSRPKIVLPGKVEIGRVNVLLQQRRKRWLDRQAALANLLPQGSTAAAISVTGDTEAELNAAAALIAAHHHSALSFVTTALADGGSAADARGQWSADRALRLVLGADRDELRPRRLPMPLNHVRRKEQPYLLRLEGPSETADLALGKAQPVAFTIHRGSDQPFDPALAEVRLQVPPELLVTHRDKPIASGNFRLQDLVEGDGQSIHLLVAPARELEISSDGKLEDPHKSLTLILTVGTLANAKATSVARFRLPSAPYLDVIVAGYEGTIESMAEHIIIGGSGADRTFHLNPPPPADDPAAAGDRSRARLYLRPMPLGQTPYRLHLVNRSTAPRNIVVKWHVLEDKRPAAGWADVEGQIGDASLQQRLKPELLPPGRKWLLPVFEEDQPLPPPAAAPAAAAAAPPPPAEPMPKPPLLIRTGLVCQLTDLANPDWSQWIWITAEPRHPDTYVMPSSRLTGSGGTVETILRDHPASSQLLPPGRATVIRGNPRAGVDGQRVAFLQKEVRGVLAKGELKIAAQLPARGEDDDQSIPFALDLDDYPRALRFLAGRNSVQSAPDRGAVQLRLLAIADPPMPGKEDALLSGSQQFFAQAPKLRYEIEADFPLAHSSYAVRLSRSDETPQQLEDFYADRIFAVACQRQPAEESARTNLVLACQVQELGGPLDWLTSDNGFEPPMRIKLRAEVMTYDARGTFHELTEPVLHELEIVLDDQPPRLTKGPPPTLSWNKSLQRPLITFSLSDEDRGGSGSGLAEVQWGTVRKGEDGLMDGKEIEIRPGIRGEVPLHIAVPDSVLVEGKPVSILLLARDRAGNRFGPEVLQTINVSAAPMKKQAPKGSDSKK